MPSDNSFAALISNFGDFLTVAIHTITFERHIYPPDTYITARKYNYPVRQSRHPKVCKWINDAITAVQEELLKGTVDRVAVVIYSQYAQPLERFMFDLSKFPVVSKDDYHTPIERQTPTLPPGKAASPTKPAVDLEEQFRAVMAKLTMCNNLLKPLPEGCTFTLAIELKDQADPPVGHPQPWVPVPPTLQRTVPRSQDSEAKSGSDLGGVATTPMRSVDAGEMVFEMWIEEGIAKQHCSQPGSSVTSR